MNGICKISIVFFALLSFSVHSRAQGLWVCSINGEVKVNSRGWKVLSPLQELYLSDSLLFSANSSITILDRNHDLVYALQSEGVSTVRGLISAAKNRARKQQRNFIAYLWNSLRGNNNAEEHRKAAGVVYRDNDVNAAIANKITTNYSSFDIDFIVVDAGNKNSIRDKVSIGKPVLFVVRNRSCQDLFVGIIDKDSSGAYSDCFPVENLQQFMQLLIPAGSEVLLDAFPCVFGGPKGVDELTLIASPVAFDTQSVIKSLSNSVFRDSSEPVGLFKCSLTVE